MKTTTTALRPLFEIARDIQHSWTNPYFGASPYIKAMRELTSVNDYYYHDSARNIIMRFLANASTWRGPKAKAIKAELKSLIK